MDPLNCVAQDEEDYVSTYDRELLGGPHDNDNDEDHDHDHDSKSTGGNAAGLAGYWTDIDLGGDETAFGDETGGGGGSRGLSPLTVSSPFLRISADTDVLKCTAVTTLTGNLRVSPLTVQPPRSAPNRPHHRSFFDKHERPAALSEGESDTQHDCSNSSGGAPAAQRAPWDAVGGVACVLATGGGDKGDADGGGGTPALPSRLRLSNGAVAASVAAAEGGKGAGAGRSQKHREELRHRCRSEPGRGVEMAVEPLHEVREREGATKRKA